MSDQLSGARGNGNALIYLNGMVNCVPQFMEAEGLNFITEMEQCKSIKWM